MAIACFLFQKRNWHLPQDMKGFLSLTAIVTFLNLQYYLVKSFRAITV